MKVGKNLPEKLKAVLFDYDGVIMDSMEKNCLAWKLALAAYRIKLEKIDYLVLEGLDPISIAIRLTEKSGFDQKIISAIVALKEKNFLSLGKVKPFAGVYKMLRELKKRGVLLALVSGAQRKRIFDSTPLVILNFFDVIVSSNDNIQPKPSPEPYLFALKKLSASPKDAIIVENSPLGIISANATGSYCIAISSTLQKNYLGGSDKIVATIGQLMKILA